ncbi:MAG: aryl-sulfate sulfotransferase, partial [Planctomycetota bacterium]
TPRGTLLLFDNDNFEARPFEEPEPPSEIRSRAAEYRLEPGKGALRQVWTSEIPGEPPHASWAMGSVEYLPRRDNVLVGYGFMIRPQDLEDITWRTRLQFNGWTQLREYTHESPPEVVWQLSLHPLDRDSGIGWNCFGAHRLQALTMP